jgi:predicted RNA-binding protein with TRAM domain
MNELTAAMIEDENPLFEQRLDNALDGLEDYFYDHMKNRISKLNALRMVEIGKEYDVQVTERSGRGDGVARIQGFVIFVKNGKVGDKVKVKVTSVGNRFAISEIV